MKEGSATQDLYGFNFLFLHGKRSETPKLQARLGEYFDGEVEPLVESDRAVCYAALGPKKIAIVAFQDSCRASYAGCVSHEALHAAQYIFLHIEANWSVEIGHHEPQCYLIGWIVRNFYLAIKP